MSSNLSFSQLQVNTRKTMQNNFEKPWAMKNCFMIKAPCAKAEDEKMIDDEVAEMGGYAALDADMKEVIGKAIVTAQSWMSDAVELIRSDGGRYP